MDEQNSVIGKMDTKLFSVSFHFLNVSTLERGLVVFELMETEFDANISSLKNFFQLVDVMVNKRSFSHGFLSLLGLRENNVPTIPDPKSGGWLYRNINIQFDKLINGG